MSLSSALGPIERLAAAIVLVAVALAAAPARATTIVPLSDNALVDRSPLILVGRVEGRLPATVSRPVTDWLVTVERVLKGQHAAGSLVVRVPGGETAAGDRLTVYGAPRFRAGKRVLLFLAPRADGTWAIAQFVQGAFHEIRSGGRRLAVRDLSEVQVLRRNQRLRSGNGKVREFDGFVAWIDDRVNGDRGPRKFLVRPTAKEHKAITDSFTLFTDDGNGFNLRWFEFDTNGSVPWRWHQGGQPGLAGGGQGEFQRALSTWNNEPSTPVNLAYAGSTTASAGFQDFDDINAILFDDPNQDIEGTFSCGAGGTLAIGGPWSSSDVQGTFSGRRFVRIQGADVVMNDGLECAIDGSINGSEFMEEVFAHELGHGLGLGHSSEQAGESNVILREALMYFRAHDDGRGARLNSDDAQGLQALYRRSTGGTTSCPPNTLCLLNGRFRVTGTYQNQFDGSSGITATQRASDLSGYLYFNDPRNIELIVKILDFGTVVKVFWGQLTNLRYTITVTDTRDNSTKTYANTPGDCGGFDDNGFPALRASVKESTDGPTASIGSCRADADTLCLGGNRFAIEMTWRNQFNNESGVGVPKKLSELTGAFSYTDPNNLEILIKALEFPDRVLVLYGALSNLEYTLRVTDTTTGAVKTYANPAGRYCGGFDNDAF